MNYRPLVPYLLFLFAGISFGLASFILQERNYTYEATLTSNFAAAIITVVILHILWSLIGGDPVDRQLESLKVSTALLEDLKDTGIQAFYYTRSEELNARRREWKRLASDNSVREVDLLGLTLWREWFEDNALSEALLSIVKHREGTVRVLFANPLTEVPATNLRLETAGEMDKQGLMTNLLSITQTQVAKLLEQLNETERERFVVKVANEVLYCSIIRVGPHMFVTSYLSHTVGDQAPAIRLQGQGTPVFDMYEKEFDTLFNGGVLWTP